MTFKTVCSNAFRKKTLNDQSTHSGLKRCLSLGDLTCLSIGGMVGGGLYVLTGTVAHNFAGPSVVISYIIAALATGLSAICYAEFGARLPVVGSAYQFTYLCIGELWAFMIGWNVLIEHVVQVTAIAKIWSLNVDAATGKVISTYLLEHCPLHGGSLIAQYPDLMSAAILTITVLVLLTGVKLSSTVNAVFTALNFVIVAIIVGSGFYLGTTKNWFDVEGGYFPYGFSGTMSGAASLVYSYIGYEVVASVVEEVNKPKRNVPLSLLISLTTSATVYVCASASLTLMVPHNEIDAGSPFPSAFERYGWQWARYLVTGGIFVATYAPMISTQYIAPRYIMAMAQDGLLMPILAKVHEVTNVPYVSTILCGFVSILLAVFIEMKTLVELLSIGQLLACSFVAICVIKLRYEPNSLRYEKLDEDTPVAVAPVTENTPLRKLSKNGPGAVSQLSSETDLHVTAFTDSSSTATTPVDLSNCNSSVDGVAGGLKEWILKSRLRESSVINKIASYSPGTVPKWILAFSVLTGIAALIIVYFGSLSTAAVVGSALFASLSLLSISSLTLFRQDQSIQSFRVPLVPFIPFACIIVNVLLMLSLRPATWLRLVIWLAVGFVIYCLYGYRNSVEGKSR